MYKGFLFLFLIFFNFHTSVAANVANEPESAAIKEALMDFVDSSYSNAEKAINDALEKDPFSEKSKNLRILQAFLHYVSEDYEKLYVDTDIFIDLYKNNEEVYYML